MFDPMERPKPHCRDCGLELGIATHYRLQEPAETIDVCPEHYWARLQAVEQAEAWQMRTGLRPDRAASCIQGVQGEIYPCKPDIFAATYEPA